MPEYSELDQQDLDNQLAEFTDQLLAIDAGQELHISAQNPELYDLQKTVALLQKAIGGKPPEKQMANRIRANLILEWNQLDMGKRGKQERNWVETLLKRLRIPAQRRAALSLVTAAAILLLVIVFLSPDFGTDLVGASGIGDIPGWVPISAVLITGLLALGWWIIRSRRR